MSELVFEVTQESDGGFCAECLTLDIFTQGNSWEELRANVSEAVRLYFFDQTVPDSVRLHLVRDEVLSTRWKYPGIFPARNWFEFCAGIGAIAGYNKKAVPYRHLRKFEWAR